MAEIVVRGVSKSFGRGRVAAVRDVDLTVADGEFFVLLGPSGCGKTTLLRMIAGLEFADSGTVRIGQRDVTALPPRRRDLAMVFQNYAIFPHLDVFENVAFPLRARHRPEREIREKALWALDLVQLGAFGDRFARQLSGGQQQRVAIARAIVFEPRIVLMDEPLGALDKNLRYDMQVEIKEIQKRLGMTVVYVTHDQEEAMNMSDRIAIMSRGRIAQVGAPSEVYEHPDSAFVGRFLGEANILTAPVARLEGDIATLQVGQFALRAKARPGVTVDQSVSLFVRPERIAIGDAGSNRVEGRVRRVSFLGSTVRYQVEIAPSAHVVVDVQNSGRKVLSVDDSVELGWAIEDSLVLVD
jgi:spermidine/putrescine ABC transporter ATP-binding subunit